MATGFSQAISAPQTTRNMVIGLLMVGLLGLMAQLYFFWGDLQSPAESSPEVTFARDMMTHHAQAVEMAVLIRDRSTDAELGQVTLDMILTQQNQVGQMFGWLELWGVPQEGLTPPMQGMGEMMGMAAQQDVNELSTLPIHEAEIKFLQLMIRHHEGGVMMAQDVLKTTRESVVKRLAESIVASQTGEISYMESLLAKRGRERLEPLQPISHDTMPGMNH
jgi:uncharacterized protein (DUF305 family)